MIFEHLATYIYLKGPIKIFLIIVLCFVWYRSICFFFLGENVLKKRYIKLFENVLQCAKTGKYAEVKFLDNVFAKKVVFATFDEKLSNVLKAYYCISSGEELLLVIKTKDGNLKKMPVLRVISYKKTPSLVIERYDQKLEKVINSPKIYNQIKALYLEIKKDKIKKNIEVKYFNRNMECLLKGFPFQI